MCAPSIPEPTQYQTSQSPVYRDGQQRSQTTGRRGTILSSNAPVENAAPAMKKTMLGG